MTETRRTAAERLMVIAAILSVRADDGIPAQELATEVGYGGTEESQRESLKRDIRQLCKLGLDIQNLAPLGDTARYQLRHRDSRIELQLTEDERAELGRAALISTEANRRKFSGEETQNDLDLPGAGTLRAPQADYPSHLDIALRAVAARCPLRFTYNEKRRTTAPIQLLHSSFGWTLLAHEEESQQNKTYAIARMSDVEIGDPGAARPPLTATKLSFDPLDWQVNPPLTATLLCDPEFEVDVLRMFATFQAEPGPDGLVACTGVVTNRMVFLSRVVELGERVRLAGPPELREQLAKALKEVIENT